MGQQLSGSFRIDRAENDLYKRFWQVEEDVDKSDEEKHFEFGIRSDKKEGTFNVKQTHKKWKWRRGQLMIEIKLDPPITGTFIVEISGQLHQGWFFCSGDPCNGKFEVQHPFPLYMEKSWREALKKELAKPYFLQLNDSLNEMKKVKPKLEDIYTWTKACPIDKVKVVIVGEQPSNEGAHGLAFSAKPGCGPSRSFKNIYEELRLERLVEWESKPPEEDGDLTSWANQGVLLLNVWLTKKQDSGSIIDTCWKKFTDAVIKHLSNAKTGLVFILWGNPAKKKASLIKEVREYPEGGHLILQGTHPSPKGNLTAPTKFLSYDKLKIGEKTLLVRNKAPQYFMECNVFLKSCKKEEINWASLLQVENENDTSTDSPSSDEDEENENDASTSSPSSDEDEENENDT